MKGLALLAALVFAYPQAERVTVDGTVRNAITGEPLGGIQVRLSGTPPGETRPLNVSGSTAADGTFRLAAPPADYTLSAQRDGFFGPSVYGVPLPSDSQKFKVTAGQPVAALSLKLTPSGVITGQVLDHTGRPANRVPVAAMQIRYTEGRPSLVQVNSGTTNERGEYRLFWVPPGNYLVAFNPGLSSIASPTVITTGNMQSTLTRTFYPGTADINKAREISLEPGAELRDINFSAQTVPVFTVSGRVDYPFPAVSPNATSSTAALPSFSVVPRDVLSPVLVMSSFANGVPLDARQRGLFELRGISPGAYDLYASVPAQGPGQPVQSGRVNLDVAYQDIRDTVIPVQPLFDLTGRIVFENGALPEKMSVRLLPLAGRSTFIPDISADAKGEFRISNVSAGDYRLTVTLPEGVFLSGLRHGGRNHDDSNVFRLTGNNADSVTVLLRGSSTSITGSVIHPEGKTGADTTVVLVPEPQLRANTMLYAVARPDETGRFSLSSVAPGSYRVFAWEGVLNTAWLNATFLNKHEDRGMPLSVNAAGPKDIRVDVIHPQR